MVLRAVRWSRLQIVVSCRGYASQPRRPQRPQRPTTTILERERPEEEQQQHQESNTVTKVKRPSIPSTQSKSSIALRSISKEKGRGVGLATLGQQTSKPVESKEDLILDTSPRTKDGKKKHIDYDYTVRPYTYLYFAEENNFEVFSKYPVVTSKRLATVANSRGRGPLPPDEFGRPADLRPRKVSMLTRDFIDDSLYNPQYGYFTRQATIYSPEKPFEYNSLQGNDEFVDKWAKSYVRYDSLVAKTTRAHTTNPLFSDHSTTSIPPLSQNQMDLPQLWHTPTELFQPYYGQAIARYVLLNYLMTLYPYQDLHIYEVGGGNGTLMLNILDFIRTTHPDVFSRTHYNIIEISSSLAQKQASAALQTKIERQGFTDKVRVINKSIFDWDSEVPEPCFLIALEVLDNLAHDSIRYDNQTDRIYQGYVIVNEDGDFEEHFSPEIDPLAQRFLDLRERVTPGLDLTKVRGHPLAKSKWRRKLRTWLNPLAHDLSLPEFIPTRYLELLDVLNKYFPQHRFLTSDFTSLPNSIPGYSSPVVQVMLEKQMVPMHTYMALQGYFDILFPTDFGLAAALYEEIIGRRINVLSHEGFLNKWADVEATTTRDGENPMLEFYQNAAFMCT
ncbi:S-adenosyl-L-methionine-dependent methyltransferase [Lipomyces oligophaga]|uniref:S-adenosyl-L-methionine-dependent methyltransferase n=1 Tax=Lipomyces oligophaga TaxID=45792 RepID=UPI0034CDBA56